MFGLWKTVCQEHHHSVLYCILIDFPCVSLCQLRHVLQTVTMISVPPPASPLAVVWAPLRAVTRARPAQKAVCVTMDSCWVMTSVSLWQSVAVSTKDSIIELDRWAMTAAMILNSTFTTTNTSAKTTTLITLLFLLPLPLLLLFPQVFYPGQSCNNRCVCSESGVVQCDPKFRCSANEKCVVKGGSASCSPSSKASCSVSGVRTVRSFDGQVKAFFLNKAKVSILCRTKSLNQ